MQHAVKRARGVETRAEDDYRRGLAFAADADWAHAADAFAAAAARRPDDAVYWLNLAHARVKLGDLDHAADAARRAVALDAHSELGIAIAAQCLAAANRHQEIVEMLAKCDLERIDDPHPHFQLGEALRNLHRLPPAIDAYLAALKRRPHFTQAHVQLGNVFERLKLHEEAHESYKTAVALGGDAVELTSAMVFQSQQACRWDTLVGDLVELKGLIAAGRGQPVPFQLLTMPSSRSEQLAAARAHARRLFGSIAALPPVVARPPHARLRVGYVSSDLFEHATAYLIAEVLERHDRARIDVHVYSYGIDDRSAMRRRIQDAVSARFFEAREMSDRALAERIRADEIDVLVDLKGYTLGARNGVFAYRAAPIQVAYLGFPATLGADFYDYLIGDATVTPLEHAADYGEKLALLPHCYQPNDRRRTVGPRPTRAQCGLPETGLVFCCFNNAFKLTPEFLDRWCDLLRQVDGSVLWLYETNSQARRNLLAEVDRRGLPPERIVWAPHLPLAGHLARLQLADLVLDTLPCNAHTTASDALWVGVPVVTTPGETFAARVAASLLHAVGLPELVAPDIDGYQRLALELANDPALLRSIRARLAAGRDRCPLFDSARYTRDLEALYQRMFERWAAGLAPVHLPAAEPTR